MRLCDNFSCKRHVPSSRMLIVKLLDEYYESLAGNETLKQKTPAKIITKTMKRKND